MSVQEDDGNSFDTDSYVEVAQQEVSPNVYDTPYEDAVQPAGKGTGCLCQCVVVLSVVCVVLVGVVLFLIAAGVSLYVVLMEDHAHWNSTVMGLNASFQQVEAENARLNSAMVELNASFQQMKAENARLRNLPVVLAEGSAGANVSLLGLAILIERIQHNYTATSEKISWVNSSLQEYISAANAALSELSRNHTGVTETLHSSITSFASESGRNVTILRDFLANVSSDLGLFELSVDELSGRMGRVEARVDDLYTEARMNTTALEESVLNVSSGLRQVGVGVEELSGRTESLETQVFDFHTEIKMNITVLEDSVLNISSGLQQVKLDISRRLDDLNSSLRQDIQMVLDALGGFMLEAQGLVNTSTAGVLVHIENEVSKLRGMVSTHVADVRSYVDGEVSKVRTTVNSQVLGAREYANTQDTEVRGQITASVNEVRRHVDSEIGFVTSTVDSRIGRMRQYVATEIQRINTELRNEGCTLQHSNVLPLLLLLAGILILS